MKGKYEFKLTLNIACLDAGAHMDPRARYEACADHILNQVARAGVRTRTCAQAGMRELIDHITCCLKRASEGGQPAMNAPNKGSGNGRKFTM
jgi:hypothetical protein